MKPSIGMQIAWCLFLLAHLCLYLCAMAPGIVAEGDSGELVTAIHTLGIPHPPGYSTYIQLGLAGTLLVANPNPLSAILGVATISILYFITRSLIKSRYIALFTASLFGISPRFITQCCLCEVYTALLLVFAAMLWIVLLQVQRFTTKRLYLFALFWGLGIGIHPTIPVVGILLFGFMHLAADERTTRLKILTISILFLMLGISVDLYLPIRSQQLPLLNLYQPADFSGFFKLITLQGSAGVNPGISSHLPAQVASVGADLVDQFTIPFFLIGIIGIWHLVGYQPRVKVVLLLGLWLILSLGFIILTNFSPGSNQEYQYRVFFLPSYFVFSIFIAIGLKGLWGMMHKLAKEKKEGGSKLHHGASVAILSILFMLLVFLAVQRYPSLDKSNNYISYDYGKNILHNLPNNSIIFTSGDNSSFPLIYHQFVERRGQSRATIFRGFLAKPWYCKELARLYPFLDIDHKGDDMVSLVQKNIARLRCYTDSTHQPVRLAEKFRLVPNGFLYMIFPKYEKDMVPKIHQLPYLRGILDGSIPLDNREQTMVATYAEGRLYYGGYLLNRGRLKEAIEAFLDGLRFPVYTIELNYHINRQLRCSLAWALYLGGNELEARKLLVSVLSEAPRHTLARELLNKIEVNNQL